MRTTILLVFLTLSSFYMRAQCVSDSHGSNTVFESLNGSAYGSAIGRFQIHLSPGAYIFEFTSIYGDDAYTTNEQIKVGSVDAMFEGESKGIGISSPSVDVEFRGNVSSYPSWGCITVNYYMRVYNITGSLICGKTVKFILKANSCDKWEGFTHNRRAEKPLNNYGIYNVNGTQVFYAATDQSNKELYNIFNTGIYNYGFTKNTAGTQPAMSNTRSNIQTHNGSLYYINSNQQVQRAQWNSSTGKYDHYLVNPNASVRSYSDIQVATDGKVFYVNQDGFVSNIYGTGPYDFGKLSIQAPKAMANTDLILDSDRVYYVGDDGKIRYFEWSGTNWIVYLANIYAVNAKQGTEMAAGDGHLFYVGTDNKLRFIDGPESWLQGIRVSSAPNALVPSGSLSTAARTGMDFSGGRLVYVASDKTLNEIGWNGTQWVHNKYSYCLTVQPGSDVSIAETGAAIAYVNDLDDELHMLKWDPCMKISNPETGDAKDIVLKEHLQETSGIIPHHNINNTQQGRRGTLNELEPKIEIYPNPASGDKVYVHVSGQLDNVGYKIIGINQKPLSSGKLTNNEINITSLSAGFYILQIFDGDHLIKSSKLIIE